MQRFKITKNNILNEEERVDNSLDRPKLDLSNEYYSYKTQNGGQIVNENNVKNFLDKPENSQLAEDFVDYLQNNTNFIEFKEIFYNNKKLANTFNEYYKTFFLERSNNQNINLSNNFIETKPYISVNSNFISNNARSLQNINQLVPLELSGNNSYYVNFKINKNFKTLSNEDYSKYFEDCVKDNFNYKRFLLINNVESENIYGNIPYIIKNRKKTGNFGYSPVQSIDFSNLQTPVPAGFQISSINTYNFLDFSQFKQIVGYEPLELTWNEPGIFIRQNEIVINNQSTYNYNNNYYSRNVQYARFQTYPMIKFEKTIYSSITVPVTIKLQSPAINNLTLYLKSENYSSAILGYDYFLDTRINTADQKTLLFNSGEDSITINVIITNNISPEDTAIFSLRDNDNKIISFLLIKCEEFSLIKKMTDKSYIKVDTIIKEKKFLNCFVDYNYNDNDLEFYRNFDLQISGIETSQSQNNSTQMFDVQRIISATNLNENSIKNIYFLGSRIYRTNNQDSDYDFTVVAQTNTREQMYNDGLYQIKVINIEKYNEDLFNCEFPTIEFRFLPKYAKIKETINSQPEINLERLYSSLNNKINSNFNTLERYFSNNNSYYLINKLIFHTLRILVFSIEIAKNKNIKDFTVANEYYNFGNKYNFTSFEVLLTYLLPEINRLKSELEFTIKTNK